MAELTRLEIDELKSHVLDLQKQARKYAPDSKERKRIEEGARLYSRLLLSLATLA